MSNTDLSEFLKAKGVPFFENAPLAPLTTFKIGGNADVLCEPQELSQLKALLSFLRDNKIPYFILGNGSNILVSDKGVAGAVISLKNFNKIEAASSLEITCEAGQRLSKLCFFALEQNLSGLENLWGIPGSVGGAVYMNAGAYGSEISDVLKECTFIDETGQVVQADVSSLKLQYRSSIFTGTNKVILSAKFHLKPERHENIKETMDDLMNRRREKQPLEYPSAGSTFKRPQGYYAGALIEECGLKGACVGGAEVSEKHAGFIINKGGATSHDVLSLIEKCKREVFLQKSVTLEPEVKFIGRQ